MKWVRQTGVWSIVVVVLTAAFVVWSLFLAVTASRVDEAFHDNLQVVAHLAGLRQALRGMGGTSEDAEAFGVALRQVGAALQEARSARADADVPDGAAGAVFGQVDSLVQEMARLQGTLLAAPRGSAARDSLQQVFYQGMRRALDLVGAAERTLWAEGHPASVRMQRKWMQLNLLAVFACLLAVLAAFLWRAQQRELNSRKQIAEALRASEERYRIVAEQTGQLIYDYHVPTGQVHWSGAVASVTGYAPDVIQAFDLTDWEQHLHPADRPHALAQLDEAMQRRCQYNVCYRFRKAGGDYSYIEDRGVFLFDAEDRPLRMLGTMTDITGAEQARAALRESEQRYRVIFERAAVGIGEVAPEGQWLRVNDRLCEITGYRREELVGHTFQEITHPDDLQRDQDQADRVRAGELDTYTLEKRYIRRDGTDVWVNIIISGVRDGQGELKYAVAIVEDISARKQAERELVRAKEQAEDLVRLKNAFLASMSHEIRTPLTSILGFTEVLKESMQGEPYEWVNLIERSGHRLMATLTSVLDLARLGAGKMAVRRTRVDLKAVLLETVHLFEPQARQRGVELVLRGPPEEVHAFLDLGMVERILNNLIGNAIKFTPQGEVRVTLTRLDGAVSIQVADTGIGISAAFLPYLFDEFQQESMGYARSHEGSGLGLAITHKLVTLLGGSITVESEKGVGSVFTVSLPLVAEAWAGESGN